MADTSDTISNDSNLDIKRKYTYDIDLSTLVIIRRPRSPRKILKRKIISFSFENDNYQKLNFKSNKTRSSIYKGVTKHKRSGRWEAHIWVKTYGRQIYLGGYEDEEHAAEAYDLTAIKIKGNKIKLNFNINRYANLVNVIKSMTIDEVIMMVRRQSQGFSRGSSIFRGVTQHPSGRWESRIGIPGNKHIYLGLFCDEMEAARYYDKSLIRLRGCNAMTNFSLSEYSKELSEFNSMNSYLIQSKLRLCDIGGFGNYFEKWIKYGCI